MHYFVSYFDYYQPEAYIASSDTYIEKIRRSTKRLIGFRHAATAALLSRRDVIIVASVSCIYGIGSVEDYGDMALTVRRGESRQRDKLLRHLTDIQYQRNDIDFHRSTFSSTGRYGRRHTEWRRRGLPHRVFLAMRWNDSPRSIR